MADRGFADCKLFYALTEELTFEYVIRLRGDIYVTNARGERRPAAAWVGAGGRARRLVGARVTDAHELPVGVVVCVHDRKMTNRVLGGQRSDRADAGVDSVLRQALGELKRAFGTSRTCASGWACRRCTFRARPAGPAVADQCIGDRDAVAAGCSGRAHRL